MNVSILIATYGDESWAELALERALPSAQKQNVFEVLVGHDPDGDVGSFRNALAEKAQGDWLCFLDADDELSSGYMNAMRKMMQSSNVQRLKMELDAPLLLTPAVSKVVKGRPGRPTFYPSVDLLKGNYLVVGTLIEKSWFDRVGGFGDFPHGFEDWALWYKCARLGGRVLQVRRAVYMEHIDPNSKHRAAWRDRTSQMQVYEQVKRDLEAWVP